MNTKHNTRQHKGANERGAALVLAIAIMTILLAIALTFYAVSRVEMENANRVKNSAQSDLWIDSALAMAMAELNRDFSKHPNATSNDFRPFVMFNGNWVAGKQWALRNGIPLQRGGVPLVDLTAMPFIDFGDGLPPEQMYSGVRSQDWLYYPRFEDTIPLAYAPVVDTGTGNPYINIFDPTNVNRQPFVTPAFYGQGFGDINADSAYGMELPAYPQELVDTWTDIDNDGDSLRDSIWIPLPRDLFFSGGEYDENLGRRLFDDRIDNNLNGMRDESQEDGINNDIANEDPADQVAEDADEAAELATFVYYGGDDGKDNDGDGLIDAADADELRNPPYYGLFLTTPLPGIRIPIDLNADGKIPDFVPDDSTNPPGQLRPLFVTIRANVQVQALDENLNPVVATLDDSRVDVLDNDLDMLINDFQAYAYVGPNTIAGNPPFQFQGFEDSGVIDPATGFTIIKSIENVNEVNSTAVTAGALAYYNNWRLTGNWYAGDQNKFQTARLKAYEEINIPAVFGDPATAFQISPTSGTYYSDNAGGVGSPGIATMNYQDLLPDLLRITHSGEPVCELAGRAAILVRDEAGKMNMNSAGGYQFDTLAGGALRALGQGATTAEIETRTLPDVGEITAADFWAYRMGTPGGNPASWDPSVAADYYSDVIYPGYGRVDDNGNALLASLNGRDDDGDGLIDEGLYLPKLSRLAESYLAGAPLAPADVALAEQELVNTRFPEYYAQLGSFEGVDEPGELQRYRPLLNLEAEDRNAFQTSAYADPGDNDGDGAVNERGELGDLQLQDRLQLEEISGIGTGTSALLRQSITTFSTDRNANFVTGNAGIRALNKLDYNFATPQQIAANLILTNNYQSVTARPLVDNINVPDQLAANRFAEGLRQGDVHIRSRQNGLMWWDNGGTVQPSVPYFPADPVLQAMQAAVDIVDNRDRDYTRSALTTERARTVPQTAVSTVAYDIFPTQLSVRERIAENEVFPLSEIEDHLRKSLGESRRLEIRDDWWTFTAGVLGVNTTPGNPVFEERDITYTASGTEAIRINEIMVRAVRRVEAEALTEATPFPNDPLSGLPATEWPNYDPTPFDVGGTQPNILPSFSVQREADPGWALITTGVLGDRSWLETSTSDAILQYRIVSSEGLPPGRYYLTIDVMDSDFSTMDLRYAVKYDNGVPDILTDGGAVFATVQPTEFSQNIVAAPNGWAFLNGTPGANGRYFLDGGGVLAPPVAGNSATFTVTVPPAASGTDLLIGIWMNGVGTLRINSLDFSQEPDHEWVELVNVSDDNVNLSNWELEVGIPHRATVPDDPFKSRWIIPEGTEIAAHGMVLLAFNKFDSFLAGPAEHRIADNGIGLADGDPTPFSGALLTNQLTVPDIHDDSLLLPVTSPLFDVTGSVFRRRTNPDNSLTDYMDSNGDGRSKFNATVDTDNLVNDNAVVSSKESSSILGSSEGYVPWDRIIQLDSRSIVTSNNPFTASPSPRRLDEIDTLEDVAAFVLRGGVFPNYPEQDGIDNDGDGGYVLFEQIDQRTQVAGGPYDVGVAGADGLPDWIDASEIPGVPTVYIPGTLDKDMVDNDFDGFVDERPYTADFFGIGVNSLFYRADLSEGVDEGANLYNNAALLNRRYGAGSYEAFTLPMALFPNRFDWNAAYAAGVPDFATTFNSIAPSPAGLQYGINSGMDIYGDPAVTPVANVTAYYQGSAADPLDWKVFSERRWYPGDNVIVTLYEKSADAGNVADRVTYNQYDVINRTIDDIAPWPYSDVTSRLHQNYPSVWRPNQMGLDFYRSLERKHPLYNGDRFGTENRWQATDGNYDDWADSVAFFEAELPTVNPGPPILLSDQTLVDIRPRFTAHPAFANTNAAAIARNIQLFGHAIWGSPLRMNTATRRSENPQDLQLILAGAADTRQFPAIGGLSGPFDYFRTHEDGLFATNPTPSLPDQRWNLSRALVLNKPYQSPGDLMRVPHMMYLHDAINTTGGAAFVRDMTMLNLGIQGDTGPADGLEFQQDLALRGATLGQDTVDRENATNPLQAAENLLVAAVDSMSTDSQVLTVAQAEFRPIRPDAAAVGADNSLVNWIDNPGSGIVDDLLAPGAWTPVFLYGLASDGPRSNPNQFDQFPNYPTYVNGAYAGTDFGIHYLFNANFLGDFGNFNGVNIQNNSLEDRWPLERRAVMFVSENRPPAAQPEALFIWDGEDGLENGEYTLYIGTYLPDMRQRIEEAARFSAEVNPLNSSLANLDPKTTPGLVNFSGGPTDLGLQLSDGRVVPVDPVTKSLLTRDPTSPFVDSNGRNYDPVYELDVITNPTEARGQAQLAGTSPDPTQKPGGLIHPDDWNPTLQYRPGTDGYIFYGSNAVGGWKPQTIRVTDNFLALRVRNVGSAGEVGVITHIVLAPRKRTPGRVNVNTADSHVSTVRGGHQFHSTLIGLPGVVDVATTVQPGNANTVLAAPIPGTDDVPLMTNNTLPGVSPVTGRVPWTPPGGPPFSPAQFFYNNGPTPPERNAYNDGTGTDYDLLVPVTAGPLDADEHRLGAFRLGAMIMGGRTEHPDGRYYDSIGALASDTSAFDYNYVLSRADQPDLAGIVTDGVEDRAIYPLSNESDPAKRFDEVEARFRRLSNLVTTRSDVYEIIMTVETGYGVDRDGDGFVNYRDPSEFVTTARSKASATYERRTPADQSGGLD